MFKGLIDYNSKDVQATMQLEAYLKAYDLVESVPDLVAHKHLCPVCNKEYYCTVNNCESIPHVLCEECQEDFCDFT